MRISDWSSDVCSSDLHVEIEEQALVARAEIFIADIASADDGRLLVGGETLVVHAPIEPGEVGEIAQHLGAPQHEGIEQAGFDIGMPVQRRQYAVHPGDRKSFVVGTSVSERGYLGGRCGRKK